MKSIVSLYQLFFHVDTKQYSSKQHKHKRQKYKMVAERVSNLT